MMLILPRREKESIRIGDDVVVTIVRIKGAQVRVGVKAPRDLPVHREEVLHGVRGQIAQSSNAESR